MSGFHEVRFPDNIAYGATGGPEFATTVVATGAGHEKRNANWAQARGRWDVASGLKKQAQIDELIAFFRARRGRAYGFRFKDWTDYKATGQLLGTGDDVLSQFQVVKHYPSGSVIEVRTITKPVAGTVSDTLPMDLNSAALGIGRLVSGVADPFNGPYQRVRYLARLAWRCGDVAASLSASRTMGKHRSCIS
jgi:uncharacterized protein (TIGR02217 family)